VTHSGPEVLFKTCIPMKFVDDDDEVYFWDDLNWMQEFFLLC